LNKKIYIIAGEASGDLHGSNLISALLKANNNCEIRAWGGDLMQANGAKIVKHYRELAFMGFAEVIANLKTILHNISFCKKDILQFRPDVLVLIDYPGFNLRIAAWAKQHNIKVVYYISPQVWAWKPNRVKQIQRDVDKMLVILPFEVTYYKDKWNYNVDFVGHPLLDAIENFTPTISIRETLKLNEKPIIALLPGSRKQEIKVKLPIMLQLAKKYQELNFVIAGAPSINEVFYQKIINENNCDAKIIYNKTYDLLSFASAALVTSGTATLETALFNVPQVVCYKGSFLSYEIGKRLVDIKYISLVNLIMNEMIVEELIQYDFNEKKLIAAFDYVMNNINREIIFEKYQQLKTKLGVKGASENAANEILKLIS
jgi:lipid-A-disaccharide synthase